MGRKTNKFFICGFSGAGKSTVLQNLSFPGLEKVDLDQYLSSQGHSPAQVIPLRGEQAFRDLEFEAIKELAQKDKLILALGGGALTENTQKLLQEFKGFWLDTDFENCWERISTDESRPLVKMGRAKLESLYQNRLTLYKQYQRVSNLEQLSRSIQEHLLTK